EVLGVSIRRTAQVALPILGGAGPGHPWSDAPAPGWVTLLVWAGATGVTPLAGAGYLLARPWRRAPMPAVLLPVLLAVGCLGLFWAIAAGHVYARPRYLLPLTAATGVHLGVALAALARRRPLGRALAGFLFAALLVLNVSGTWPRMAASAEVAAPYRELVE